MRKFSLIIFCVFAIGAGAVAKNPRYVEVKDISYFDADETDAYRLERCYLDLYYPKNTEGFGTLVWFHGGGLTAGEKGFLDAFREKGFAVVNVSYRLSPKASCPAYIMDAAQSVAWVFKHIEEYGGDPDKIFVGGYSAGAYLTLMVGLAKEYMDAYGVDADKINKLYSLSGQTTTHFTVRGEKGIPEEIGYLDEFGPLANSRAEGAPIMLITGDPAMDMPARYEENALLNAVLCSMKHPCEFYSEKGCHHGTVIDLGLVRIIRDIRQRLGLQE